MYDVVREFPDLNFFLVGIEDPIRLNVEVFASLETSLALRHVINVFPKKNCVSIDLLHRAKEGDAQIVNEAFTKRGIYLAETDMCYKNTENGINCLKEDYFIIKIAGVTQ